jgi:hypothetical protein
MIEACERKQLNDEQREETLELLHSSSASTLSCRSASMTRMSDTFAMGPLEIAL